MRACVFLFFFLHFSAYSQQYHVTHFSQKNGLPQNSVNGLFWDRYNLLWIATEDGLVRYDGNKLWCINDTGTSNILKNRFRWIIPSTNNTAYAAVANGYVYELNESGQFQSRVKGWLGYVRVDYLSPQELLWLIKNHSEVREKKWKPYPYKMVHSGKTLWALGKKQLYKYEALTIVDSIALPESVYDVLNIGQRLILVSKECLYTLNAATGKMERAHTDRPLAALGKCKWYPSPIPDRQLVLSGRVLYRIKDQNGVICFQYVTTLPDAVQGKISGIIYNEQLHQYAIGTYSNGLYLLKPVWFRSVNNGNEAGFNAHVPYNDSTVIATDGNAYTTNGLAPFPGYNLLQANGSRLLMDQTKTLWSCKNDSLLIQSQGKPRKGYYTGTPFKVKGFLQKMDTVLVITPNAILKWRSGTGIPVCFDTLMLSRPLCKANGELVVHWLNTMVIVGSEKGIVSVDPYSGEVDPLSDMEYVWMLSPWNGGLIGSSFNKGLFVVRGKQTMMLPTDPHGFLQKAHLFYEAPDGTVFVTTNKGMLKTRSQWIEEYLNGNRKGIPWTYITDFDGLENNEFNGSSNPGVVTLKNGMVSFANMGGLVWFNPQQIANTSSPAPKLYLARLLVNDNPVTLTDTIVIPSSAENIQIEPGCIYWGNPLDIDISYVLEGYMSTPLNMNGQTISFTQLPAGSYTLVLEASAGIGLKHKDTLSVVIVKQPKFYETLWFYVLVFGAAVAMVVMGTVLREKRLSRQNRLLEQKVTNRTAELQHSNNTLRMAQEELQQSIRVKNKLISIIAHDIVTPLKFISLVAKNFKTTMERNAYAGKEVIDEIYHTSQHLFDNAQNILEWIRYQNNLIRVRRVPVAPYVIGDELTELFADMVTLKQNTISNQIEVEDMISTDPIILKIILQNLVANAVKHTRDADIVLTSEHTEKGYRISVQDSGQGINEQGLRRIEDLRNKLNRNTMLEDSAEGTGLGYIIIFELSVLIGAQIEIQSVEGKGTTVSIVLNRSPRQENFTNSEK